MKKAIILLISLLLLTAGCSVTEGEPSVPIEPSAAAEDVGVPSPDPSLIPPPSPLPSLLPSPEPPPEPEPTVITIQFAGDILLHDSTIENAKIGDGMYDFKPFFEVIKPWIGGDLALCNMETPVDVHGGNKNVIGYPRFNAPFEILEGLEYAGFNHLIHANNHVFDQKLAGLQATLANFARAGFSHTGTYADEESFNTPTMLDVQGIQIGVLAYTDAVNGLENLIPDSVRPFAVRRFSSNSLNSLPKMAEDIAALREAGAEFVIVSLHWGAEYVDKPTQTQQEIARGLAEAGADAVMGGHAHCVQPIEWHEREDGSKSLIMYSLGNFLSDQSRRNDPLHKTQYGMLVSLTVTKTPEGDVFLGDCTVLPTLCARNEEDRYTLLPQPNPGDAAVAVSMFGETTADWGNRAYEHIQKIVGEGFLS